MLKFWNLPFNFILLKAYNQGPVDLLNSTLRFNASLQNQLAVQDKRFEIVNSRLVDALEENHKYKNQVQQMEYELNLYRSTPT